MNTTTITFNGQKLFGSGKHWLIQLSWRRETENRGFAGLDGVVGIDFGLRERKLKQRGFLSASSKTALAELIESISGYIDGQSYELVDQGEISYSNVRMDSFKLLNSVTLGNQVRCEYEIEYTQLSV